MRRSTARQATPATPRPARRAAVVAELYGTAAALDRAEIALRALESLLRHPQPSKLMMQAIVDRYFRATPANAEAGRG